jgi:4-hydroxybenzoate polyprenyltransferase
VGLWKRLRIILEMIKIEHTLFALPFALTSAMLAADGLPTWSVLFWILVCMVAARSSGMAFNRLVDLRFDRKNPRTATRALPAGLLKPAQVWQFVLVSAGLFLAAAWQINSLTGLLGPVALMIIWGYSFTKRFTQFCHLFLGLSLSVAPAAAWIAVRGALEWPALLLCLAVLLWAGGFDVIYACQDVEFDRSARLRSLPAWLGVGRALFISRAMHAGTVLLLGALGPLLGLGPIYMVGVVVVGGLLAYEHSLVRASDLSRVNAAFFTMNGFVSIGYMLFAAADRFAAILSSHGGRAG